MIDVAAGLIFHESRLLITQRFSGAHLGDLWEFPGGKREPGESFEDCLVRELREELGIEVAVGRLVEDIMHAYAEKTVRLRFYCCALRGQEPQPLGCQAMKWIRAAEFADYRFPAADGRLLEKLRQDMGLWK
ncbi:MAG TPA: 8-oxo-dGTP diphosphatase MutT [Verrucomicrobiae bacterium]|nr:8-oxo-dGTP diphosphatase MutT [Verrucomicrobiae bacterium]